MEKENFRFFGKISEFGIWNNSETMVEKSEFEMFMNETKIIVNEQNKTTKQNKLCIYSTHAKKYCDHEQQQKN